MSMGYSQDRPRTCDAMHRDPGACHGRVDSTGSKRTAVMRSISASTVVRDHGYFMYMLRSIKRHNDNTRRYYQFVAFPYAKPPHHRNTRNHSTVPPILLLLAGLRRTICTKQQQQQQQCRWDAVKPDPAHMLQCAVTQVHVRAEWIRQVPSAPP